MKINCVFFNNRVIYLIDELPALDMHNFHKIEDVNIKELLGSLNPKDKSPVYLYGNNGLIKEKFKAAFKTIKAAGGLVQNEHQEILFIFRDGVWDLPKGKIDKGEKKKKAAIREVEEETGVKNLKLLDRLENTYHIYKFKGKYILKVTYWYHMTSDFKGVLTPQLEEGITKVVWLSKEQQLDALKHTYGNIKRLVEGSG